MTVSLGIDLEPGLSILWPERIRLHQYLIQGESVPMKLESARLENNVQLIKLIGTLDVSGVNEVEKQFVALCAGEAIFVLVDLSLVNFLSSIGIPLLINSAKGVSARGGRLAFINPQVNVRAVLDLTGVLHSIRIYPDIETGLARIKLD